MSNSTYTGTYGSIYVPASLVDAYKSATNWVTYSSRIGAINGINSYNDLSLLYNSSHTVQIGMYFDIQPTDISVISDNNNIVSVSNINYTSTNISFDITTHDQINKNATITISATSNGKVYSTSFTVNVLRSLYPTYTIEELDGYTFKLNSNNYYESNNKGVNNSFAICKVNIEAPTDSVMYVDCINYAESNYDYGILSNLDTTLTSSSSADSSSNYIKSFKGSSSSNIQTVSYNISAGTHYIYIKFIKDSSSSTNNDSLQFKIRFE